MWENISTSMILMAKYRTDFFLENMTNIDQQIYDIVASLNQRKYSPRKELWIKYFIFLYLSGARRTEPFRKNPIIELDPLQTMSESYPCYLITKVSEKHFERKKEVKRKIITQTIIPLSAAEKALFERLMQGKRRVELDFTPLLRLDQYEIEYLQIMEYLPKDPEIERKMRIFSWDFRMKFHANINTGEEILKNSGLVPHMLRHIRAFDQVIVKRLGEGFVLKNFDWSRKMLDYYLDLKRSMGVAEQRDYLSNYLNGPRSAGIDTFRQNIISDDNRIPDLAEI